MTQDKLEEYVIPPYRVPRTFYHSQKYFQYAKQYFYRIVKKEHPKSILDVGCGHGLDSAPIMKLGVNYVGVDPIEENLELARKDSPLGDFRLGYMQELPFEDNSFDWVFAAGVWDILSTPETMKKGIDECMRVAKRRVYSLDATTRPRFMTERYMMIPMHYGLSIIRVNYNPEKDKADYLWCIEIGGIK